MKKISDIILLILHAIAAMLFAFDGNYAAMVWVCMATSWMIAAWLVRADFENLVNEVNKLYEKAISQQSR